MCPADQLPELDLERVVCTLAELGDPGSRAFTVGAGDWPLKGFVVRRGPEVHAYVNRCPHAGHPLNLLPHDFLTLDRSLLLCRSHGALFEIATGRCIAGPCAGRELRRVPIEIVGGCVLLAADVRPDAFAD
jgi:nitrite reductase/ring-hydroxylating ferredoxin subunit